VPIAKTKKGSMEHEERLCRRLFRNEKFIVYNGGDRSCAPDLTAFFVVIDLPESISRTPLRHGQRSGGVLVGGQKNFEFAVV
jgi:hypothetical protein